MRNISQYTKFSIGIFRNLADFYLAVWPDSI